MAVGQVRPVVKSGKAIEMDKRMNEIVAGSDDESLQVFVRSHSHELTLDDLEVVAGGRGARWDPLG